MQVDRRAPRNATRERETGLDGKARDDEARHDDEADYADRPPEADDGDEVLQEDREDDPTHRPAAHDDPDRGRAVPPEPVAHNGDGWIKPAGGQRR